MHVDRNNLQEGWLDRKGGLRLKGFVVVLLALSVAWASWEGKRADATIITVPGEYASIQAAVDAASSGDTVQVSAGTYYGKIVISKSLHLVGESRDTTTIDGQGCLATTCSSPVIFVNSSSVEVKNFLIRNADIYAQGVLVKDVTGVNITGTMISATVEGDGVTLSNANNSIVTDNIFSENLYAVNATDSFNNLIARNIGLGLSVGVFLWSSQSNIVANNSFTGGESGVELIMSQQNRIIGNLFKRNDITGIQIEDSTDNEVLENSFQLNRFGINIQNSQSNTIYHNSIISSTLFQVNHVYPADKPLNTWNNGTAGNFWDDYYGADDGSNGRVAGDGIGDTAIPHLEVDNYPLMTAFVPIPFVVTRIAASVLKGPAPLTVALSAEVLGGTNPYYYQWSFGDGGSGSQSSPSHTYSSPGSYFVRVTVSDAIGRSDGANLTVTVEEAQESSNLVLWFAGGFGAAVVVVASVFFLRRRRKTSPSGKPEDKKQLTAL